MITRWWAPSSPSVEVDDDTLAMLHPGQDPEKDLGIYLLAAHRAGAGALSHMAKSSIGSETSLVTALTAVRPGLSEAMVDAIAPITGEVYAALLVRDVLDEADQGALDVYRNAVSKGVAPPIALERAAAGYGVPTKEMGAFAALSADPKANPRAVEDAADRSLMSYVAKVAAQEAVTEISKAEQPQRQRSATATETEFDEAEHPRGPDGRFIDAPDVAPPMSALDRIRQRLGLTSTEPAKVAETTRTPTLVPSKADPVVEARQARARRAQRAQRAAAATRTKPAAAAPTRAKPTRAKPQRSRVRVSRTKLNRLSTQLNERYVGPREVEMPEGMRVLPDLLKRLPDPGGAYYDIGQPVIIGTGMIEAAGLRTQASTQAMTQQDSTRRIFRIGHLANDARYVEQQGTEQARSHRLHAESVHRDSPIEFAHPIVQTVKHHELTGNEREDKIELGKALDRMAERDIEMPSGDMRPVIDSSERKHMQALPVYEPIHVPVYDDEGHELHDHEEAMALIHWQPTDPARPDDRPVPVVEEYVILTDARGREEGSGRSIDIHLDPNQVYEVVRGPHADPRARIEAEPLYDLDEQVVVNRWYLRPVDEDDIGDIIKALSPAQAALFERLHPRDAEGQFTETETETVTAPTVDDVTTARQARTRRAQRVQRAQAAPARAVVTPTRLQPQRTRPERSKVRAQPQRSTQRTALVRALERKATERAEKAKAPVLSDTQVYKIMPEQFFQNLFPRTEVSDADFAALHRGEPLELTSRQRMIIAGLREVPVDGLGENMALNVNKIMEDQRIERELLAEIRLPQQQGAVPDYDHVSEQVDHILRTRPDLDLVELGLDEEAKVVMVWGSRVSGSYQNVIEIDPELSWTGPLYLTFHGEHRATDMLAQGQDATYSLIEDLATIDVAHEGAIPNPYVHYYRLTSAPVRRFRMDGQ